MNANVVIQCLVVKDGVTLIVDAHLLLYVSLDGSRRSHPAKYCDARGNDRNPTSIDASRSLLLKHFQIFAAAMDP
jgi:hypothetical protein